MEFTLAELRLIAEALRHERDRYYRHPSEVSEATYQKNRRQFEELERLRYKAQGIVYAVPSELDQLKDQLLSEGN